MWLRRRCRRGAWCAALAALALLPSARSGSALPPIRYEGEFLTQARARLPEDEENSYQLLNAWRLRGNTFLWQPWFATLELGGEIAQVDSWGASDSNNTLLSGDTLLSVFPSSRFPFTAFASVSDNTTEIESIVLEDRIVRRTHFGATQQYRPLAGNAQYSGRIERTLEDSDPGSLEQVIDRAEFNMDYNLAHHNFNGSMSIEDTGQESPGSPDSDFLDFVATMRHGYRPSERLSVESFATYTRNSADTGSLDLTTSNTQLSSFAVWRPVGHPLTVTGNARYNSNTTEAGPGETTASTASLNGTARYDFSRALRGSVALDASRFDSDFGSSTTTSQSATLSYTPDGFDLLGFDYSWFASGTVGNRTGGADGNGQNVGAALGHGVNRVLNLGAGGAYAVTLSANQAATANYDTINENDVTVTTAGSAGVSRSWLESSARATVSVSDNRTFSSGPNDGTSVQDITAQGGYDARFGRYQTLTASVNVTYTRQNFSDGGSETFPSSSITAGYRHGRLFGVRRLTFRSDLRTTADSLTFFTAGDQGVRQISFENELRYSIGRVEMRAEGTVTDNDGQLNTFVFFSLSRRIGGVF